MVGNSLLSSVLFKNTQVQRSCSRSLEWWWESWYSKLLRCSCRQHCAPAAQPVERRSAGLPIMEVPVGVDAEEEGVEVVGVAVVVEEYRTDLAVEVDPFQEDPDSILFAC